MVKNCLKNFFINLKYYFTPIGALAIGIVIGLSVFIPGAVNALSAFLNSVAETVGATRVDFQQVLEKAIEGVTALDWGGDPVAAFETMISKEWLEGVLKACLDVIAEQLAPYSQQINEAWGVASSQIVAYFAVFVTFTLLGLAGGFALTRFFIRRNIAKRAFWKVFISGAVDFLLALALFTFSLWLSTIWSPAGYISVFVSFFLYALGSLCSAFIIHGSKKLNPRKVISFKNALLLLVGNLLVFIIIAVFLIISVVLTNAFAGIFIGYSFVIIGVLVISLNAEAFVKNIADNLSALYCQ